MKTQKTIESQPTLAIRGIVRSSGCLLLSTCILIFACGKKEISDSPEELIRDYFAFWGTKNEAGMKSITTEIHRNTDWEFDNLKHVTLRSISDCTDSKKEIYLKYGRGLITRPYDLKVFCTAFDIKVKQDRAIKSGKYTWTFTLIRQSDTSNWLIDDWGY